MINKSKTKEPMPTLENEKRKITFCEVELGLSESSAKAEAARCLGCKNSPCKSGCPVGVDIPKFISLLKEGKTDEANSVILEENLLPGICGRVCPQEKQCEKHCIRSKTGEAVAIGRLERYAYDNSENIKTEKLPKKNGKKVAIIGSGPSGLTCAGELSKKGYETHVFEALHKLGGVLCYGIPAFRLPEKVLEKEIGKLKDMGVKFHTNTVIGKTLLLGDLFEMGFSAVYTATGAGLPKFMGIKGEGLAGVCSANEFLTRVNLMKAHEKDYDTPLRIPEKLVVIGGGNVAMDAARCAVRIGCKEVTVIYRRTEEEMPARKDEILHAKEEGVKFMFLRSPLEFKGKNGVLNSVKCVKMKPKGTGPDGKNLFQPEENSEIEVEVGGAVIAIGGNANRIFTESEKEIKLNENGCILTSDGNTRTSKKYVYAGGDAVSGAATVILAMQAGKKAAAEIHQDLLSENF